MNPLRKSNFFTLLALAFSSPPLLAAPGMIEEEDLALAYGDKETISIATGSKQALRRAPAVASVITAEEIAAMGATDLDEVLETVPGLHVSRASARYTAIYMFRGIGGGINNPQVLMLQNGIPMTTMFNSDRGAAWVGVPLENIARIEVIRGPGSALYGADAYAGVINLITKTAADTPGTEAGLRGGSFGARSAWVQHGGQLGPLEVAGYLRVGTTDGIREIIRADAQTRNDQLFGTRASLAPGAVNTGFDAIDASLNLAYDKWRLRAAYKLRDDMQTGAGLSSALDPGSLARAENVNGDLSWSDPLFAQNWGLGASAALLYYTFTYPNNLQLYPPGVTFPSGTFADGMIGGPNQWEKQFRFSAYATYSGVAGHNLRFGLGHDDLDIYRTKNIQNFRLSPTGLPIPLGQVVDYTAEQPYLRPQNRQVDYVYVQDEWRFAHDWTLTAGLRHDNYSDFGGTTNPRLALVWDASFNLTAKLLYGKAFRAPSFNEEFGTNPVANGNASLKPETIETVETALSWKAARNAEVNLSLFHYQAQDMIRLVANTAPIPGSTWQNTGNQHGSGLEMEALWDATHALRLTGNYSFQKSIDEASGRDAGYAPHHHLYGRADWRFTGGWLLSGQINRVADRKRPADDNRSQIPDYTTFDLTLRSTRGKNQWNFSASARNLFDATVLEPSTAPGLLLPYDLPMAPRSVWVQAVYKL